MRIKSNILLTLLQIKENSFMGKSFKFTLIELMVVIAIILILMSLLLPSLNQVKQKSLQMMCLNNQKQIGVGILMYANDENDFIPTLWNGLYSWTDIIAPYCTKYSTPADAAANRPTKFESPKMLNYKIFACPSKNKIWGDQSAGLVNYVTNYTVNRCLMVYPDSGYDRPISKFSIIKIPSQTGLLWDGAIDTGAIAFSKIDGSSGNLEWRHNNGLNILFADGHSTYKKRAAILPIAYGAKGNNNNLWQ